MVGQSHVKVKVIPRHATTVSMVEPKYWIYLHAQDIEFLSVIDFNTRDLSE